MPNRFSANLAALLPAFQSATQAAQGIQNQQRQTQADALNQQLMDLRIKQQKAQLDALKVAQEQEKIRLSFKDQFFQNLQAPTEPTGAEQGAPRGSSLDANAQSTLDLEQFKLAEMAGQPEILDRARQAGFASPTPEMEMAQRREMAALRSQQATAGIQEQSLAESKAFAQTREALAQSIKNQASSAKGIDKQRFQLMGQVLETATPGQLPQLISELYPRVEEPTSAFQALLRQTGSPQKALKIMGDIERENAIAIQNAKPLTPRKFGEGREAIAAEMYNGRAFADLTPNEMAQVNKRVEEARTRIAKASLPTERLPAGASADLVDIRTLKLTGDSIMKQFKPEFVGKMNFVGNKLRIFKGNESDKELFAFVSDYNNMIDMLARDRTGAVIGPEEASRFMKIMGSLWNEPEVFKASLTSFIRNLDMREKVILDINAKSIGELQGQGDLSGVSNDELLKMWNEAK